VLAAAVFRTDVARRKALFPRTPTGEEHLALPPESCSGDGITLGESAGGSLVTDLASRRPGRRSPKMPHATAPVGHFPHIIDRAKPGIIGVLPTAGASSTRRRLLRLHRGDGRRRAAGEGRWPRG
jgi:hypothetical protein